MTDRILDFSLRAARLSCDNGLLRIQWKDDSSELTIPLTEISSVILSHPQVSLTQSALAGLAAALVPVITCDARHRPVGMMLPLEGHQEQHRRFRAQVALSAPRTKRLWQIIVQAKIQAQAQVLEEFHQTDFGLRAYAKRVGSGDPSNVEAQAARRYWSALFLNTEPDAPSFVRSNEEDVRNHMLNYGYAVLRAAVTRGLCACGLHPSFGLHHHGPFNTFPLADDLVEPFRPAIDRVVQSECIKRGQAKASLALDTIMKGILFSAFTARYGAEGETRILHDWILVACQRLARAIQDPKFQYSLPAWQPEGQANAIGTLPNHVASSDV